MRKMHIGKSSHHAQRSNNDVVVKYDESAGHLLQELGDKGVEKRTTKKGNPVKAGEMKATFHFFAT